MTGRNRHSAVIVSLWVAFVLLTSGCGGGGTPGSANAGGGTVSSQAPVVLAGNTVVTAVNKDGLPLRGKPHTSSPPAKAAFGMIYRNTTEGREYIYDGVQWVPHDATADTFYKTKAARKSVVSKSLNGGAHDQHGAYGCETCHRVDWANGLQLFWFDKPGSPAFGAGMPAPVYNDVSRSCSNIACHGMPQGVTFSYYFPDGTGEPALNTVTINSNPSAATPTWYSAGVSCAACHGNPPLNGSNGSNVWHSGQHAPEIAGANECQFCHPDVSGTNMQGTTITMPGLHANGAIDVQATFTSNCFHCH